MNETERKKILTILNKILELELAGVVRYTHYSFMIFGYNRIPIVDWMKTQAQDALTHAHKAGEAITLMGAHPSLKIGELTESHKHDIGDILRESLEHEQATIDAYYELKNLAEKINSVFFEEYARGLIYEEEQHLDEVNKMLRQPGEVTAFKK